ncbi:MAG: ferrous iron transporter B, partial [Lachnospiraceae bacterium]|nr:ferrous iron transporter B [Lachnospiraceae bacterium]
RSGIGIEELKKEIELTAEQKNNTSAIPEINTKGYSSRVYNSCCNTSGGETDNTDRKIDKYIISKTYGIPIMLLILAGVFWITIVGANYPSAMLSRMFVGLGEVLKNLLTKINCPELIISALIDGVYKTLTWIISVMLPPMAIFFPLFTLMEDSGYLPRIAFNLDSAFQKANAHGKQSLTMAMGFGCNACGVTGCRIIDSPRERLIAIITNSLVPCNGRFPTLIAIISMFFLGAFHGMAASVFEAVLLLLLIILSVTVTLIISRLLSETLLKGIASSFVMELPPYRRPQLGKVIVRSIFDRTLFVLFRAIIIAAPAGLFIWILANITVSDKSILQYCTDFLDPIARVIGLDGAILMAFILGFPANEIVLPIVLMIYMSNGVLSELPNLDQFHQILTEHGWTVTTAICTLIFVLFHAPCSTTCLTIYKETKSAKWTLVSFLLPLCIGTILCFFINSFSSLLFLNN